MRKIGCLVRWVLFTLNILVAIGFLISAYSPYISPVSHPLWACAGLFFPFLFLANLLFIFVSNGSMLFFRCWFLLPAGAVFGTIVRWDQKRNRKEER